MDILLRHWSLARSLGRTPEYSPDAKQVLKVLAPLALWMHETSPGVGLVKEQEARRKLMEIYRATGVDDPERASELFLADVRDHANLLVERGSRQYGFIHLTFQEYLAAVAIAQQGQQSVDPVVAALGARVGDDNWREVSLLAVGYLGIVQDRNEAASAVLSGLVEQQPGPPGAAVVLAGQALLDVGSVGVTPACRQAVIQALETTMSARAVPPRLRLQAGLALADLGMDPPGLDDFVAAAGLGLRHRAVSGDQQAVQAICGRRWVRPKEALVDKESRRDITSWEGGRWPDRPRYWDDDRFNHSTQPVVGVSWHEANAYCAWLTGHLRDKGILTGQQEARLPTQAEWEQAARSSHGRAYPWGTDDFDPARANTEESGLGQTTPVHLVPGRANPGGRVGHGRQCLGMDGGC